MWGLSSSHQGPVLILILEDDVTLSSKFSAHLQEELGIRDDCDLLQLGMTWLKLLPGQGLLLQPASGWGLFAYILSPQGRRNYYEWKARIS